MTRDIPMAACRIGIAGAGIAGLAAAAFLARAGHHVTVFDQFERPGPVGSGVMLQETGLIILEALQKRAAAEALGARVNRLFGISADTGRPVLDVSYDNLRKGMAGLGIQRSVLFSLLHEAAMEAGACLVSNLRIESADVSGGCFIDDQGGRHGPFDLLVDALGVRSALSGSPKRELAYGALWTTLPWPESGNFQRTVLEQRYHAARQMAGVMPSGREAAGGADSLTYFWSIRTDQYEAFRNSSLTRWKEAAIRLWPETAILLDQVTAHEQLAFARYRHRTHWPVSEGRLVHIGDAWHAASPQLGQGANMALLDAFGLNAALTGQGGIEAAMLRFRRLRGLHVRLYQWLTFALTPVYQSDGALIPWMRDHLASRLLGVWPVAPLLALLVAGAVGAPLARLSLPGRS